MNKSHPLVRHFTVSPEGHLAPDSELSSQSVVTQEARWGGRTEASLRPCALILPRLVL